MVGYLRRFCVTFRKAKNLLCENALGEVSSFKAYAYSSDFSGNIRNSKIPASRGGVNILCISLIKTLVSRRRRRRKAST